MCQYCAVDSSPASAGPADKVWGMFTNVMSFPARMQGMLLNAMVNTIDKVQTDQVLRETKTMIEREKLQDESPNTGG